MTQTLDRRAFLEQTAPGALAALATRSQLYGATPSPKVSDSRDMPMDPFPIYRCHGDHRSLGRQHGEQAAEKIGAHLEFMAQSMNLSRETIRHRALQFRPLFEKHCGPLLPELKGLAEGARMSLADALAVNIRGALTRTGDGGCTAFAIQASNTAEGSILVGQNSDMLPVMADLAYVLHLKPDDQPEMLMWTFGGMIGYHGLNSAGVAQFANDVGGGPAPRFAMPHYPLKRTMLECSRLDEMVERIRTTPVWISANYVLCDGHGAILDVEVTPDGFEVLDEQLPGAVVHANHFLHERLATDDNHRQSAADSFERQRRLESLIRPGLGQITLDNIQRYLRDQEGAPTAICRIAQTDDISVGWERAGITVASIVAEPAQRRMHVAAGNSDNAPFVTYEMD